MCPAIFFPDAKACDELKEKLLNAHEKFCTLAVNPCPGQPYFPFYYHSDK
jgi:hypothetical protein